MSKTSKQTGKYSVRPQAPRRFQPILESLEDRIVPSVDAVLRWNAYALDATKVDHAIGGPAQQFGPTRASRALAIVQIAVYDAVNAIDQSYTSFYTDAVAPSNTNMDAAVAQAAHDTMAAMWSAQKATFDQELAQDLAAIPDGPAKANGISLGAYVAAHTLAVRSQDGSQLPQTYTFGSGPGVFQLDPLHPTQHGGTPLDPEWGDVTTFGVQSGSQFQAPPPPALNSPEYTAAFNEVKQYGNGNLTPEQEQIGLFWGYDAQPGLCAPVRFYNQIADVIAEQENNTEVQNARFFALINAAMADAAITVWNTKYTYNFWRPITAIREANTDGNPDTSADPNWTPLGAPADNGNGTNFTPPFPSYTSGHAGIGGALFRTMADFYGTDNISFTIVSDEFNTITVDQNGVARPLEPRSYTRFSQAEYENAESRIYLGIHFGFDRDEGITQGNQIGDWDFAHLLRPRLTSYQHFVNEVYRDLIGRSADLDGLAYWSRMLDQGVARSVVVSGIQSSTEYRTAVVESLYTQFMHRTADANGLNFFVGMMGAGATVEQIESDLMGSAEYFQSHGGGTVNGFLAAIYQDALHRTIDSSGQTSFTQLMESGMSATQVALIMAASTEFHTSEVQNDYQTFLRRSGDASGVASWVGLMNAGMSNTTVTSGIVGSAEYFGHQ
jgi:hypothetical protein